MHVLKAVGSGIILGLATEAVMLMLAMAATLPLAATYQKGMQVYLPELKQLAAGNLLGAIIGFCLLLVTVALLVIAFKRVEE